MTISKYFKGVITETTKNAITKIAKKQGLSPLELESIVFEVASGVKELISNSMVDFGLELKLFNIEAIPIIDDDPRVKKVIEDYQRINSENYARKTELQIIANNLDPYKQKRSFDTSEKVAENMGGGIGGDGGNIVGTMIGLGMSNPLANSMGAMMQQNTQNALNNTQVSSTNYDEIITLLQKLGELKTLGILTEEEFNEKKKELLAKIK
jgi:membrane protease subunit (stomatin/prohibitin family)